MRRPVQSLPISPKLLKHFAGATVVLTGLIALFAGGEQSQLGQELAEREARNKLAQTEAEQVGSREVADAGSERSGGGSWGSAGADNAGFSGGSTDPNPPPMLAGNAPRGRQLGPNRGQPAFLAPPPGAFPGGDAATMRGLPAGGDDDGRRSPPEPSSPSADQAAALLQSSMARSGSSGDGD
ncbi:hypothetical protein [Novosphingobium sp.]|uniref:hypothetical protein n=1 Tax=Novosphingobium sp. TaxID=1874826 RepID=UPI0027355EB3|nr:hypothetical protein [Novosphingobium sp.]MDP3907166.1 hypothetical protein [Novosphingobium sp.]